MCYKKERDVKVPLLFLLKLNHKPTNRIINKLSNYSFAVCFQSFLIALELAAVVRSTVWTFVDNITFLSWEGFEIN